MSSLHSCRWDWCRFTTASHEHFVQHVISAHIDKAEPVKREDINLIRHVEEGGVLSIDVPTSSQLEAPQPTSQSVESTHSSKMNHLLLPEPGKSQMDHRALSFASGSTRIVPFSSQKQLTSGSESVPGEGQSLGISQLELQTQAAYRSQTFD
ncbi:hypothetical protein BJV78DRAFT_1280711 [Lactifluus subvellereus]|nr:hypothetical protein BJV78DRAFT_1288912 [Lactifluus subvellereus]KAI0253645.1 hypothetical protein BJV78DRAFT_1280711 [Lactifluus subvellereus]